MQVETGMIVKRFVQLVLVVASGYVAACDQNASATGTALDADVVSMQLEAEVDVNDDVSYEMESVGEKVIDEGSPLGYWEVDKTYPVLKSDKAGLAVAAANRKISSIVTGLACDGKGEEVFNSEVVFLGERIFSMRYEAMWMCAATPSPDRTSGTLNVDLSNGSEISLVNQFKGEEEYWQFAKGALARLNERLHGVNEQTGLLCPLVTELGEFYVDADTITVRSPAHPGDESRCNVEVRISRKATAHQLKPDSALYLE